MSERYRYTFLLTALSAALNLSLAVVKMIVGKLASSHSLFADGLHSLSDLITDALVFYAAKMGQKDADADHPYGHERFETAGTLFVSLLLVITGLGICLDVIEHLGNYQPVSIHISALVVIAISIVSNEILFQVTRVYATRVKSDLLLANAWHHRSDAWSSVVVLLGVLGSYYGYPICDVVAAFFVACLIIKMGIDLSWSSVKELVDTAVDEQTQQQIKKVIEATSGVVALHELRTRQMSNKILVDVHLIVAPRITVSEGHYIGDQVQNSLRMAITEIEDVVVHIDPEDDEENKASSSLPNRQAIIAQIEKIAPEQLALQSAQIHYLGGKLELDLICDLASQASVSSAQKAEFESRLRVELPAIHSLRILYV